MKQIFKILCQARVAQVFINPNTVKVIAKGSQIHGQFLTICCWFGFKGYFETKLYVSQTGLELKVSFNYQSSRVYLRLPSQCAGIRDTPPHTPFLFKMMIHCSLLLCFLKSCNMGLQTQQIPCRRAYLRFDVQHIKYKMYLH